MAAGQYNFTLEQGTTFRREFIYKDKVGAVVNLTGYSARMQIRQYKDSGEVLVNATTANAKLTITPLDGKISLILQPADTDEITFYDGVYDLEIVASDGTVTRLVEGTVTFNRQVTR